MSTQPGTRQALAGRLLWTAVLTLMWAALYADFGVGTLTAGALVAVGVQALFPALTARPGVRVRPLAAARLALVFGWMLLTSNLAVARRVLTPRVRLQPVVVSVDLPPCSDAVATVVANAVTLTPGTLTLDATRTGDRVTLLVHNLDAPDEDQVRDGVLTLYDLVAAAFPAGATPRPEVHR